MTDWGGFSQLLQLNVHALRRLIATLRIGIDFYPCLVDYVEFCQECTLQPMMEVLCKERVRSAWREALVQERLLVLTLFHLHLENLLPRVWDAAEVQLRVVYKSLLVFVKLVYVDCLRRFTGDVWRPFYLFVNERLVPTEPEFFQRNTPLEQYLAGLEVFRTRVAEFLRGTGRCRDLALRRTVDDLLGADGRDLGLAFARMLDGFGGYFAARRILAGEARGDATFPFLKSPPSEAYTLVIDLDETLICYQESERLRVRPFANQFLEELAPQFELVIFTAAKQDYADPLIDSLDVKRLVRHRLYRQHLTVVDGCTVKDLSRLGRELAKVVIVDNLPSNFSLQRANGIAVESWMGDPGDHELLDLLSELKRVALSRCWDVREQLALIRHKESSLAL